MKLLRQLAVASALLAATTAAPAQQVQWKQTINLPKGFGLSQSVQADILGIELGDTYAEAKAKLQKLVAEAPAAKPKRSGDTLLQLELNTVDQIGGADTGPALREVRRTTLFNPPGGGPRVEISYVGQFQLKRELPGAGQRKIEDELTVQLSAPSSGHQVIAIDRNVIYLETADQPRITGMVDTLKKKFHAQPFVHTDTGLTSHWYIFDDGRPVPGRLNELGMFACPGRLAVGSSLNERDVPAINAKGVCDVSLEVEFRHGISRDHASSLRFQLSGNERAKQNLTADYAFFRTYIQGLQQRTGGPSPKL